MTRGAAARLHRGAATVITNSDRDRPGDDASRPEVGGLVNKVLILSASAGAGHVRAAEAIERAFARTGAAREVRHIDTLQFTNRVFRRLYSKAYVDLVNKAPEVLGWLYDYLDMPWEQERRRLAFHKLNTRRFVKMLKRERPDLAVCTHFLPAEILSWLKAEAKLACPQAIVLTDFDLHAMWLCHHFEHYFVVIEETREHLVKLGIPADKVSVTGIPIDPVFGEHKDKRAMRQKLGLRPELTVVLVSAGGFGAGPIEHLVTSLLELRHPAEVVVICGRNPELKERLDARAATVAPTANTLTVVGFTTAMDEYMAAADILVGKPGGLTTSEALAKGLLLVIVNPIPGQEERNSDHLLEEGVAIRCNNLPVLAYKIDRLLDDPQRVAIMRDNARRLARPDAADAIVRGVVALARG
jgi:processive 1,2-diacylglycerol beta-glucosyltransferase